MARDFFIHGENMVSVKGNSATAISTLTQLGLAADPILVSPQINHSDILVDAFGGGMPVDTQFMLAAVTINMTLIHFDAAVLDICLRESMAGASAVGTMSRAGKRMGANTARFNASNHYIGLNLHSPVAGKPYRFYFAYLTGTPMDFPLGAEKSMVRLTWRAIPYTTDPWGNGTGAEGVVLWDNVLDS